MAIEKYGLKCYSKIDTIEIRLGRQGGNDEATHWRLVAGWRQPGRGDL